MARSGCGFAVVDDASALVKGFQSGREACTRNGACYQGRWRTLWNLLDDMSWAVWRDGPRPDVQVTFKWMKAHQRKKDVAEGRVSGKDWKGNAAAGELAKRGAASHRVPRQWVADLNHLAAGLKRIYGWVATPPALATDRGSWHDVRTCRAPPRGERQPRVPPCTLR